MESTDVSRGFNCLKAVLAHWTFVQQLKNKNELRSGDEAFQGTPEYTKPGIRKNNKYTLIKWKGSLNLF